MSLPPWVTQDPVAVPATEARPYGDAIVIRLHEVQPRAVEWLWPNRVPLGKLTLLSGDPGLGKSLISLDMAARVSAGRPWFDCQDTDNPVGSAVLLTAEDDAADTIVPRLIAAGADLRRIVAIEAVERKDFDTGERRRCPFSLDRDLSALEAAITSLGDCRLAVVDPVSAYLGSNDSHVNSEIRALLAPLAEMASRCRVAVVVVNHLNKGASGGKAMYRSSGSLAFVAAARAAWGVAADQQDPSGRRRLVVPIKNNLGPDRGGVAYFVEIDNENRPFLAWDDRPVEITADDAFAEAKLGRPAVKRDEAVAWLVSRLSHGSERSEDIFNAGVQAGFCKKTLFRAKDAAGIVAHKSGFSGSWIWRLPNADGVNTEGT